MPTIDFGSIRMPNQQQQQRLPQTSQRQTITPLLAEQLLTKLRNTPADVTRLRQRNQPLADAVQANDLGLFLVFIYCDLDLFVLLVYL